jgi:hypothetical protein
MAAGSERAGWGTTRRTFLVAGGCLLAAALVGAGRRHGRGRADVGESRPRRAANLAERDTPDGIRLRPTPVDPRGPVFTLNRSGAVVWKAVDGRRSTGEIAGELAAAFGLTAEAARRDTIACLRTLAAQGLVCGVPAAGPADQVRRS